MSPSEILRAARELPIGERMRLAQDLWDDIEQAEENEQLSSEDLEELERRADEALRNPDEGHLPEKVFAEIDRALRSRG